MPKPFRELNLNEFEAAVGQFAWSTEKAFVHVHCTDSPNHEDFRLRGGLACVEAMHRYHTEKKGWSDIAQHVTIDPDGKIWTGRGWNRSPASAVGHNDSGVFMFEMIGLFDVGSDPFSGDQEYAAYAVTGAICHRFGLDPDNAIRFHNQFTQNKTCPGTAIGRSSFVAAVAEMIQQRFVARSFGMSPKNDPSFTWLKQDYDIQGLLDSIDVGEDNGIVDDGTHDHSTLEFKTEGA